MLAEVMMTFVPPRVDNIIGKVFGKYIVKGFIGHIAGKSGNQWLVQCECGIECQIGTSQLKKSKYGCLNCRNKINGQRSRDEHAKNRLNKKNQSGCQVIKNIDNDTVLVKCRCGQEFNVSRVNLSKRKGCITCKRMVISKSNRKDLVGFEFGDGCKVIRFIGNSKNNWLARCGKCSSEFRTSSTLIQTIKYCRKCSYRQKGQNRSLKYIGFENDFIKVLGFLKMGDNKTWLIECKSCCSIFERASVSRMQYIKGCSTCAFKIGCINNISDLNGLILENGSKVISFSHLKNRNSYWLCVCRCGEEFIASRTVINNNKNNKCSGMVCKSCHKIRLSENAIRIHSNNLVDQNFGNWFVINKVDDSRVGNYYLCRCKCGTEKIIAGRYLSSNATTSCGCSSKQRIINGKISSFKNQQIYKYLQYESKYENFQTNLGINVDVAVFINNIKIAIEYDEWYWHHSFEAQERDLRQTIVLINGGWKLLRIKSHGNLPKKVEILSAIDDLVNTSKCLRIIQTDTWIKI